MYRTQYLALINDIIASTKKFANVKLVKNKIQKITPNLCFDTEAEEAANFYASIFKNSRIGRITRYGKERHEIEGILEGTVMTIEFQMEELY
jgi:predicted 3-demethylubiquinone-9 3-methyltransferase (glyoxalase superfamily)